MSPRRDTAARRRAGQARQRPLGFYDHHRQHYADRVSISEAGQFLIGDYNPDGTVSADGEFKITLIELAVGGRWALHPRLEAFGDGIGSLRRAIDAGLLDSLNSVDWPDQFARRLLKIGMVDRSDTDLPDFSRQAIR